METLQTENGEYCVLTMPGGTLDPDAARQIRNAASRGADCIYADESFPGKQGPVPIRKPDYAPDTLLSYNCIGLPLIVSAPLYHALGGLHEGNAEQLYLFTLRAAQKASYVHHIPRVLLHGTQKPKPLQESAAILRALSGISGGNAQNGLYPGSFYVRYGLRGAPRVSVVCIAEESPDPLRRTLESVVCASSFTEVSFVVVYGGIPDGRMKTYLDALERNKAATVVRTPQRGNRAALQNLGARAAFGDVLLFLDAGITLGAHDAIERLVTHTQRRSTGAAGGKIVTRDGRIVQAGLVFGLDRTPRPLFAGERDKPGTPIMNQTVFALANVSAVSHVLCIRTATFFAARGFDETFPVEGCEAELCLRLMRARRHNVYDPLALFRLPGMPLDRRIPDKNQQRLTDAFRLFSIEGDPMAGRGAWLERR